MSFIKPQNSGLANLHSGADASSSLIVTMKNEGFTWDAVIPIPALASKPMAASEPFIMETVFDGDSGGGLWRYERWTIASCGRSTIISSMARVYVLERRRDRKGSWSGR